MEEIINRIKTLIERGNAFHKTDSYYFDTEMTQEIQMWITSVVNIVSLTVPPESYFQKECDKIVSDKNFKDSAPTHLVTRLTGVLEGLLDEIQTGFFRQLEYIFTASAFDEFLDHAENFHKGGKKMEASVLASIVMEDTVRKIAKKNSITESGLTLEPIIDSLVTANVFTPVKARRVKGLGALRNKALHSQWEDFDLRDVGGLISGTRELLEHYL